MLLKKGYMFYMDGILIPVPPSRLNTKFKNKNKVINLINEGDFNILKEAGLTEISFDMMLPAFKYPFANYLGGIFLPIKYYLEVLEMLKKTKKPFNFIVVREGYIGTLGYDTCMKVSLENWQIKEDAGNGNDVVVTVNLKEYKDKNNLITKVVNTAAGASIVTSKVRDSVSKIIPKTYKVKEGDTLYTIAKKELGDGNKFSILKKLNDITGINLIKPGQVIRLE